MRMLNLSKTLKEKLEKAREKLEETAREIKNIETERINEIEKNARKIRKELEGLGSGIKKL